jgi:Protein of unknown function (DUF4240)
MTDALFWHIVSLLDWSKWRTDQNADPDEPDPDEHGVLEPAIRRLAELPVREIYLFDEFLSWRLYTLDTREHALNFAPGEEYYGYVNDELPFSTDGFKDCRAMVIARGQQEYEKVLADPTQMAREGFESFAYLASYAFRRKTGADYEYEVGIDTWAGCNKAGWMRESSAEPGPTADGGRDPDLS